MKVDYSRFDTSYACAELAQGLRNVLPNIRQIVTEVAEIDFAGDKRTLYVCVGCPCCIATPGAEDADVIVSPFRGVDPDGLDVKIFEKYPPFRRPGKDEECESVKDFEDCWRVFLRSVLMQHPEQG